MEVVLHDSIYPRFYVVNTIMDYYKFLPLDTMPLSKAMLDYINAHPSLINHGKGAWTPCDLQDVIRHVPLFNSMFDPFHLTVKRISLFVMFYKIGKIHIDDDAAHPFRINFPILNCKDTETRFYKVSDMPTTERQLNRLALHFFDPAKCELVDSFELDRPVIIKTQEPHQVIVHHSTPPRISCTVAFNEDLTDLFNRL